MKLIRKLLLTLLVLIVLVIGVFFAGVVYLNKTYEIDTFSTLAIMKKLHSPVSESDVVKNPYSEKDLLSTKAKFSLSYDGFLQEGEDGISFRPDAVQEGVRKTIYLTDRELACLCEEAIKSKMDSHIAVSGYTFSFSLRSLSIDVKNEKESDISMVSLVDISDLKKAFSGLAGLAFGRYVPKTFYLSLSFSNTHGEDAFTYSVTPNNLLLNSLSEEETDNLFSTIGKFVAFPKAEEVTKAFSETFMDTLIGKEGKEGILYSMKAFGAKDYSFVSFENENCLSIIA